MSEGREFGGLGEAYSKYVVFYFFVCVNIYCMEKFFLLKFGVFVCFEIFWYVLVIFLFEMRYNFKVLVI